MTIAGNARVLGTLGPGFCGQKRMSMKTSTGLQSSGTTVEPATEDNCDECAKLDDGFPCADCYISRHKGLGDYR